MRQEKFGLSGKRGSGRGRHEHIDGSKWSDDDEVVVPQRRFSKEQEEEDDDGRVYIPIRNIPEKIQRKISLPIPD